MLRDWHRRQRYNSPSTLLHPSTHWTPSEEPTAGTKDSGVRKEGKAITTSLKVAETFGKLHKHVLRDIEALGCSAEFTGSNFGLSEYRDSTGRRLPMYEMTRKGFTLLAMGFTGAKAMQFKIAYVEEFDRMEAFIEEYRRPQAPAAVPDLNDPATLRSLLLDYTEKVEELTPKAEAYDDVISTNGLTNLQQLGRIFGYKPNKLIGALRARFYITIWYTWAR